MNPNAKITDEQFEAYLKQIRELAEGPFEEIQKEVEVTNTFPEEFYELAKKNDLYRSTCPASTADGISTSLRSCASRKSSPAARAACACTCTTPPT